MTTEEQADNRPSELMWRPGTRSPCLTDLFAAMAKAQGEIKGATKDATNPHFSSKYADLSSVWDVAREPLSKNGLAIIQWPRTVENGVEIETILTHSSGQYMSGTLWIPCSKFDAQGIGSASTYGRRYALMAIAGVAPVADDDDGNAAVASGGKNPPPPKPRQSSENGRRMASDDQHLVDTNRNKGSMAGSGDALRLAPNPPKLTPAQQKAKTWVDSSVGTLNLSDQSKESLRTFWKDNKSQIDWLDANMATEYERLLSVYDQAMERAVAREG